MRAGQLRHRVHIERDTATTQGDEGHTTESWTFVAKRWAKIEPLSGRELWDARQLQPQTTHKITMRADSVTTQMTAEDRIAFIGQSRYFHPTEPPRRVDEIDETLEVMCKEKR